jgi:hypothetical protein
MIENGLILTGSDAESLSRALSEVKAKVYEESETSLDDTQALDALLSSLRTTEKEDQKKEARHTHLSPCVSGLSWALLSTGKQGLIALAGRDSAERRSM